MKAYLRIYALTVLILLLIVGSINFAIDPLWYAGGNQVSHLNPPWNERITKTNLLLNHAQDYDCVLLGTSRSTLFDTAELKQNRCFNYSFSGGKLEEFVNYAKYLKEKGIEPQKLYVEVELDSFDRRRNPRSFPAVTDPLPWYRAYFFSADVLQLSLRTLTQDYDFARLYDRTFRGILSDDIPTYEPEFSNQQKPKSCDPDRISFYQQLKQTFPNTQLIGFIAPVSAWFVYNNSYSPSLLDCQLAGIYQAAALFDAMYDFAVPSAITSRTDNTYDGNHYYPIVYQQVASVLEGRTANFGVNIKQLALSDYQALYKQQIKTFLTQVGEVDRWRGEA